MTSLRNLLGADRTGGATDTRLNCHTKGIISLYGEHTNREGWGEVECISGGYRNSSFG